MANDNIKKIYRNRVGAEDLTLGTGTEQQTRSGQVVTITKINAAILPYDETKTLEDVYDEIKDVEIKLDTPQANGNTVEENIGVLTSEPTLTDLNNAEENATNSKLDSWIAEAHKMTSDSYATEPEDVFVKTYTSNGDGTFTSTDTTEYSALHWKNKAAIAANGSADNISYDNTTSGMAATNVQEGLDELDSRVDETYSKTELDGGQLDNRYYTEPEVDTAINIKTTTPLNISSMLKSTASLTNTIQAIGFNSYLYTGDGLARDIVTGVDMKSNWEDYSGIALWSAGTYNTDDVVKITDTSGRVLRCVCLQDGVTSDPNTLLTFTDATFSDWKIESKTFGGRAWFKNRDTAAVHNIFDTLRGATNRIQSNATAIEVSGTNLLTSFNVDGVSIGDSSELNGSTNEIVSWSNQTTFVESFLTSHNKPAIRETNVITGYVQIKFKGSGLAGHKIEHGMGRELGFINGKNLTTTGNWSSTRGDSTYLSLNQTIAETTNTAIFGSITDSTIEVSTGGQINGAENLFILYGYTNAYIDENNILQGNYQITQYQSTGVSGSEIELLSKPTYLMIKEYGDTGSWAIFDILRQGASDTGVVFADLPNAETTTSTSYYIELTENGFKINHSGDWLNNGSYLVVAVFGDDLGKSVYVQPTDTTQLQEDTIFSVSNGYNSVSGVDNKINTFSGTVIPTNGWSE